MIQVSDQVKIYIFLLNMISWIDCIRETDALSIQVVLFITQGLRVYPVHRQQTIIISSVSGKEKEQGMQQCRWKRRMQKICGDVKCVRKIKVLDKMLFFPFLQADDRLCGMIAIKLLIYMNCVHVLLLWLCYQQNGFLHANSWESHNANHKPLAVISPPNLGCVVLFAFVSVCMSFHVFLRVFTICG